ncbi:MAG: glutamate--tRNA ligase family protein, partial [Kiritimatiellae bacterium]|nr:glutamate--tRNA ligase family protein [Kiritimatiellia bacterium]
PPRYAHLPMIVNKQGKPYSKRDGAAFVGEFRERGFLPDALFNFLALLGWSPGENREIMTREEMIALFDLKRVKSHPAMMDMTKCEWMNGEYIRRLPRSEYCEAFRRVLQQGGLWQDGISDDYLAKVAALMQVRTKTYRDLLSSAAFFFTDNYSYDPRAVKKRLQKEGTVALLTLLRERLAGLKVFDEKTTEEMIRSLAAEMRCPPAELVHPLRVAVSGLAEGPGLFEVLALLGKEKVLGRIDRTLRMLEREASVGPTATS